MRIVSLCPSLTELVFDLGRGHELVGITEYCVHPREALQRVEAVGGTKNPKVARIAQLHPDWVLLNEEENRREDAQALERAGVRCHSSMPRDCAETANMVRSIAAILERPAEGQRIANEIERRSARVQARAPSMRPVRFAYLIWRKPWMSVSHDTFASSLLCQAGGINIYAGLPLRYPEIAIEALAELQPERVFLCTEPFPFQDKHREELAERTGLARERFVVADGEYLSWHGSRTPAGIDYAEALIDAARRA